MLDDNDLRALVDGAPDNFVPTDDWSNCMPSRDAFGRNYADPEQLVEGFLTVGLTVLSATPKAGKTWLVHECAVGVATGSDALGTLPCLQSEPMRVFRG